VPDGTRAVSTSDESWHDGGMDATVVLGQQGRLVVPADMRSALGIAAGDRLHLHLSDGRLVVQRPADAAARLRGFVRDVPRTRSLVDELLHERRAEATSV